jgi:hypothetical protein
MEFGKYSISPVLLLVASFLNLDQLAKIHRISKHWIITLYDSDLVFIVANRCKFERLRNYKKGDFKKQRIFKVCKTFGHLLLKNLKYQTVSFGSFIDFKTKKRFRSGNTLHFGFKDHIKKCFINVDFDENFICLSFTIIDQDGKQTNDIDLIGISDHVSHNDELCKQFGFESMDYQRIKIKSRFLRIDIGDLFPISVIQNGVFSSFSCIHKKRGNVYVIGRC